MKKKLKPIIKWTGGKYKEFGLFAKDIPAFDRYIEPFFGGGGVFFALQPGGAVEINDKSTDLINFYKQLQNPLLQQELLNYADAWDELNKISEEIWPYCELPFLDYLEGKEDLAYLAKVFEEQLFAALKPNLLLSDLNFVIDIKAFKRILLASMVDKVRRIKQIGKKEEKLFTLDELRIHFETGIKSGAYLYFRHLLNLHYKNQLQLNEVKAAANWYFVREFCYGSMFRFNAKGEFNIPYGGITYNRKKFRQKVNKIFTEEIKSLFKNVNLLNLDFEKFLSQLNFKSSDFIFLDPPYDSEFSEYDQSAFTRKDQQRLADFITGVEAKWMIVIKETPFIREIYTRPNVKIKVFYKNYTYNVRGRNDRKVQHLIITNY